MPRSDDRAVSSDVPNESDRLFVERTVRGDREAFGELVRRHLAAMHAVAVRILGESADADDVCQDAFLSALLHLETFDPSRSFRGWLHEIVRHRALDVR